MIDHKTFWMQFCISVL